MTPADRAVLTFAGRRWNHPGLRDEAITTELRMTPTAYTQRLNALLDDPEALREFPATVLRLRRLRDTRRRQRSA